jgi:flagellin-like protein
MKLKNLFTDDDAVSPVIGVILMVAITVILAAVIGAFVLGIGSSQEKAPQASIAFDYDSTPQVTITHDGGETFNAETLTLNGDITTCGTDNTGSDVQLSAGSIIAENCDPDGSADGDIQVTWTSSSGDSTQIIGESSWP